MINIDKYINFSAIWYEEIYLENDDSEMVKTFLSEDNLEFIIGDCQLRDNGDMLFVFGESGGQNESDNQGWSRGYELLFNSNFELINIEYFQG